MMKLRMNIRIPMTSTISTTMTSSGMDANHTPTFIAMPGYGTPMLIFQTFIIAITINNLIL